MYKKDYCRILGVNNDAAEDEIKKAYTKGLKLQRVFSDIVYGKKLRQS